MLFPNEFLIPYNEFLIHMEIYTWEIRARKKKLTILPSETSYLNTLGNLFPILIHWEIYSLS